MHLDKKNKQTTHHHEVSFKTFNTAVIKQEAVFLKKQQIFAEDFLFYEENLFQFLDNRQNSNCLGKYSLSFCFTRKGSKFILVIKSTEGSTENLQPNSAHLPP